MVIKKKKRLLCLRILVFSDIKVGKETTKDKLFPSALFTQYLAPCWEISFPSKDW